MQDLSSILKIEQKWQKIWDKNKFFKSDIDLKKKKFYCLSMFPYPSGKIHIGHIRNYTIGDTIAIRKRLQGYNVLNPIGWDSFGLPAENAAIQKNIHPLIWTEKNIQHMKSQILRMGYSYDWDREIKTCDPDYYKWQQLFFIKFFKKNLAYQNKDYVNWCPHCKTVLANEQVEKNLCWRCQFKIEKKNMKQWFLRITNYADILLDYSKIKNWPTRVILMQKNWISKKSGFIINFFLNKQTIPIFTTRPETIYGVTFIALCFDHPIIQDILSKASSTLKNSITSFIIAKKKLSPNYEDKYGIFTEEYASHPLNHEKVPIFICNFVLSSYGTGALMGVPAHDERDFLFAKKYGLPIKIIIQNSKNLINPKNLKNAYTEKKGILINSDKYSNLDYKDAKDKIVKYILEKKLGKEQIFYRLKDWLISRQRYWGTPIPIIYCQDCGIVAEKEENLPIYLPTDTSIFSLKNIKEFVNCICPTCKKPAKRETDTMDTFICSSWYFLRFASLSSNSPFNSKDINYWLPVDQYIGGIEHAILHLLYARFFTKALKDINYTSIEEPFKSLLTQGMVVNKSYFSLEKRKYFSLKEIQEKNIKEEDLKVTLDKMSKSKKNGIDPEPLIKKYGVDSLRLFILFAAPIERDLEWNQNNLQGSYRFILKLYKISDLFINHRKNINDSKEYINKIALGSFSLENYKNLCCFSSDLKEQIFLLQKLISDVNLYYNAYHFNTIISSCMKFSNQLESFKISSLNDLILFKLSLETLCILLFPIIPHTCEEIHFQIGFNTSIYTKKIPKIYEELLIKETTLYIIQINGITRCKKLFPIDITKEKLINSILNDEKITKWLPKSKKDIKNYIFIPNKVLNIVI